MISRADRSLKRSFPATPALASRRDSENKTRFFEHSAAVSVHEPMNKLLLLGISRRVAWFVVLLAVAWSSRFPMAAQKASPAMTVAWSAPYQSDLTEFQPVWFGRDGSALLGQPGRTNWLWVAHDGQRATLSAPFFNDPMQSWAIVQLTSRVLLAEVRTGGILSSNATWLVYRRNPDGSTSTSMTAVNGTAFPPSGAVGGLNGRSVTRGVSRIPPDGWFATEMDTGGGSMSPESNRILTLYKLDTMALEAGGNRPVLAMERGDPIRLRIEVQSGAPLIVYASEDLRTWFPWAALIEPGASAVLPVDGNPRPQRYFKVQQLMTEEGAANPWE